MRILLIVALVGAWACASTGQRTKRDHNLITRQEVESTDLATAYELVRTLRPRWLRKVGPSSITAVRPIAVYIDGTRVGGPRALETVPKIAVQEIRYYPPTEAQARWGLNHTHGAVAVITRRGGSKLSRTGRVERKGSRCAGISTLPS